jgi:hypothetical protein
MRRPPQVQPKLAELVRKAERVPMSSESRERQLQSFAYGNAKLEDERVTKALVASLVEAPKRR